MQTVEMTLGRGANLDYLENAAVFGSFLWRQPAFLREIKKGSLSDAGMATMNSLSDDVGTVGALIAGTYCARLAPEGSDVERYGIAQIDLGLARVFGTLDDEELGDLCQSLFRLLQPGPLAGIATPFKPQLEDVVSMLVKKQETQQAVRASQQTMQIN